MQFTEKFIQALKPKAQRYDVREGGGDGFAIRIFPTGQKSWFFFYFFEGRKRRMTFGTYPDLSLANARKLHRNALNLLAIDKDPGLIKQNEKIAARISSTVEDLVEEYLEKWAKVRKRSWKADQRTLQKNVLPSLGKRKAKDITKRDILLILDKIKERGAPIAANRTLACVRRMFNFAIERDIVAANPCASVKTVAKENRRDRCLSAEEIKSFWHGLNNASMSEATKLVLKFQLTTAQRKGEIIAAEWNEIDLIGRWWTIPAEKAKNGQPHRVALSQLAIQLLEAIKNLCGDSRWVFPSAKHDDTHITATGINRAVLRSTFTNVKHMTPHDLRRTAASFMTSIEIPRLVVSKILNHVDSSITAVYDRHSYDAEKRNALERWGRKLEQIINDVESADNIIAISM